MLLQQLEKLPQDRVSAVLEVLNSELRSELQSGKVGNSTIPVTSVARLLMFYAYSLSDDKKSVGKRASANSPSWTGLSKEITAFVSGLPARLQQSSFRSYTDDKIAQFATLASRVKGTASPCFYSTFVLFLIYLNDNGSFDKPYVLNIVPKDDLKLLSNLVYLLSSRFNRQTSMADSASQDGAPPDFEAAVRFNVLRSNNDKLTRFINYYGSGENGNVHLVLYRAMKSDPLRLMKTFLILSPPRKRNDGANNAVFSHFYKAPNEKRDGNLRFSGGKVLPLDQGVYLVGGQRPWRPDDKRHPFTSLKVIAFEWIDLDQCHPLMTVLVMSTNYKGNMFVSRAVARVTPMTHHADIELEAMTLSELSGRLAQDYKHEAAFINGETKNLQNQPWIGNNEENFLVNLDPENSPAAAGFIIKNTNNNPRGNGAWAARDGFRRISDKNNETLTSAKLQSVVEDSLIDNKSNQFVNDSGEMYEFWSTTRFGPLSSDAEN